MLLITSCVVDVAGAAKPPEPIMPDPLDEPPPDWLRALAHRGRSRAAGHAMKVRVISLGCRQLGARKV